MKTESLQDFAYPDPDEMGQGDQLLVWFIDVQLEEIGAMQTISQ